MIGFQKGCRNMEMKFPLGRMMKVKFITFSEYKTKIARSCHDPKKPPKKSFVNFSKFKSQRTWPFGVLSLNEGRFYQAGSWSPSKNGKKDQEMAVSKNRDTPKWMVYNGKPY